MEVSLWGENDPNLAPQGGAGLRESIRIMDVATPLTFEDQGGRSEGAIAGWSWDYEDSQDEIDH